MIAYLTGMVHSVKGSFITLLLNGIGFAVHVPAKYHFQCGDTVALDIYAHMTQENGIHLYGFKTSDEKEIFLLVIGCSGMGPKIGLAIVNALTPSLFVSAVLTGDVKTLSSVDGIGPKKAENIIMQLKDKVAKLSLSHVEASLSESATNVKQLSDVLTSLGYSRQEITATMEHLKQNGSFQQAPFDELVRKGLGFLAKRN